MFVGKLPHDAWRLSRSRTGFHVITFGQIQDVGMRHQAFHVDGSGLQEEVDPDFNTPRVNLDGGVAVMLPDPGSVSPRTPSPSSVTGTSFRLFIVGVADFVELAKSRKCVRRLAFDKNPAKVCLAKDCLTACVLLEDLRTYVIFDLDE